MPIYHCSHCPRTYVTQGELASHKRRCHSTASVSASFQPNQGGMMGGPSPGSGSHPWSLQIDLDYSHPLNLKLEASDGPPSAKRRRGASKAVTSATRRLVYHCDECPMAFPSYHALGGHKSGHRKIEARLRSAAAQLNQVPPQPQPQEGPPSAAPSPQHAKHLFDQV